MHTCSSLLAPSICVCHLDCNAEPIPVVSSGRVDNQAQFLYRSGYLLPLYEPSRLFFRSGVAKSVVKWQGYGGLEVIDSSQLNRYVQHV